MYAVSVPYVTAYIRFSIENTIDGPLLLNGAFIDTDPVTANVATNIRYKADYSLVDLGLKSYTSKPIKPFAYMSVKQILRISMAYWRTHLQIAILEQF